MITEIREEITAIKKEDPLTQKIIACCFKVHSEIGPGFNEKIYHKALKIALEDKSLRYQTQKEYKVVYQNKEVGILRADLVVEDSIIVELKALTGNIPKVFETQVLSYLKVTGCKIGLLINFGNRSCQKIRRLTAKSL